MFRLFSIILFAFPLLAQPKLNVDYIEIPEGLVKEKGVTEIFWYGCPACLEYENTLEKIKEIVDTLKTTKTRISFFVDPDTFHIDQIKLTGADRIELYTGPYAVNPTLEVVSLYEKAFNHAKRLGLGVNAGHDLDLNNLQLFLSKVPADEVSIGHALISDALINGLEVVTKQFLDLCK